MGTCAAYQIRAAECRAWQSNINGLLHKAPGENKSSMAELATILTALEIDGQPVACEHAVLISGGESQVARQWVISILGVRLSDLARLSACRAFSAIGGQGERFMGTVRARSAGNCFHLCLEGEGPLRKLSQAS